ncbi:LysM peptidoglycan-binding domain-containing protein [Blastococcus sp. SYSU D00922]
MGSVQQAVLEFDEEVQAPWRPRLVVVGADGATARPPLAHPSRRSPSRVGVCRPPVQPAATPAVPSRRPATPRPADRAVPAGAAPRRVAGPRADLARVQRPRLRLTRRARRLAVVMALACGVALGSWLDPLVAGNDGGLRLAGESSVVVRPGDTLWSIASAVEGGGDVRALVDEIQVLNRLQGSELVPGQTLVLP